MFPRAINRTRAHVALALGIDLDSQNEAKYLAELDPAMGPPLLSTCGEAGGDTGFEEVAHARRVAG